ncbi:putative LRR receptor-like serine/threonine-protein kinase [Carex littledalei]|uniref:Putative LRR receptor-like serine/threonine-protein kinase n=1 Tax=Carex littledalei TaxID=544730 RepID=A0A833V8D2_9POAL|nr:putative LRR receptor-like serine/threonine-protein kinase [Carex littledalei]
MHLWCSYLLILLLLVFVCVQGQNPSSNGFINIDCGITSNTSYVDSFTGLTYVSDDQYIDTGLNDNIPSQYTVKKEYRDLETLRRFPNGTKNCYTLTPVTKGSKYLVRATFYYGNYDGLEKSPSFDLYFGVNFWFTVSLPRSDYFYAPEIIAIAPANYIQVCLVNTGLGTPFISALELRPLNSTLYKLANATQSLNIFERSDLGSNNSLVLRYPYDEHDRLWYSYTESSWNAISTGFSIEGFTFEVPSLVLQTAVVPSTANSSIDITWSTSNKSTMFFVVLHFAEIQIVQNTSLREFYVYANGEQPLKDPVPLKYLTPGYVSYTIRGQKNHNVSLKNSASATLPPILNAYELYTILPVTMLPTDATDVSAIESIKTKYSIRKYWNGDPCLPTNNSWTGVICTINSSRIPRITVLNLSSSGLTGAMVSAFGYLTELEKLYLSTCSLNGATEIISQKNKKEQTSSMYTHNLTKVLNFSFNSPDGGSGHKKSSKAVIFIIVAVVIVLLIVGAVGLFFLCLKMKKKDPTTFGTGNSSDVVDDQNSTSESGAGGKALNFDKKQFSFSELKLITNDFREKIGIGGFGEVFKGRLGEGNEVAVKVRSDSSSQGTQQFLNEVEMLSRVHHKNLVSLVGYCNDGNYIALIYEYMQEGNLQDRLKGISASNAQPLSWKQRLRIAYESAQGTPVFTNVVGTLGYLDPQYVLPASPVCSF